MATYYPPVNFHFSVSFGSSKDTIDAYFQSVSGLDVSMETETIKEGGINHFEHVVPTRSKFSDLVLKRGKVPPKDSKLADWCKQAFEQFTFSPQNLVISLLNEEHEPLMTWKVICAWPKSWKMSELNAEKGEVLIETLELNYNYFEILPIPENENVFKKATKINDIEF